MFLLFNSFANITIVGYSIKGRVENHGPERFGFSSNSRVWWKM